MYASIGKQYQPFGKFTTSRVESTVGKSSFRTRKWHVYRFLPRWPKCSGVYVQAPDCDVNDYGGDAVFKEGGARVGYNFAAGDMTFDVIASYETNTPEYSNTWYRTGAMDVTEK